MSSIAVPHNWTRYKGTKVQWRSGAAANPPLYLCTIVPLHLYTSVPLRPCAVAPFYDHFSTRPPFFNTSLFPESSTSMNIGCLVGLASSGST